MYRDQSGCSGQFVGFLDVGYDLGGLPQRSRSDGLQGDGPVAGAVAGQADDFELDASAQRVAVECKGHPPGEVSEGRPGLGGVITIEIHFSPLLQPPALWRRTMPSGYCWR